METNHPEETANQTPPAPATPPDAGAVSEMDYVQPTKWPKVLGIISLIYAIIGVSCMSLASVMMGIFPLIPPMFRGGVEMPPFMRFTALAQSVILVIVGLIMLFGAIGILRRRRAGVAKLKLWAVLRLILLVIAIGVFVITQSAQIQMARDQLEFRNDMLREQGRTDMIQDKTDEELWRSATIRIGITTGLQAIYPLFLGLYLSRRKITDEIADWDEVSQGV